MPNMNTLHTFTMLEAYKHKQYINGVKATQYFRFFS